MHRLTSARAFAAFVLAVSLCAAPVSGSWAAGRAVGSTPSRPPAPAARIFASAGPPTAGNAAHRGPFVTILFSRSEMTAADNCTPDNDGIAGLATTVAPYLWLRGMSATGTLETGNTKPTAPLCVHYNDSLGASWADAANLADNYGWSFGSATATYPVRKLNQLSPAQAYAETCGSARSIDAHGLPGGHGIITYPGTAQVPLKVQDKYGARCFAWGRLYGDDGTTQASAGSTPPYWQHTTSLNGGSCHVRSQPCHHIPPEAAAAGHGATCCRARSSVASTRSARANGSRSSRTSWSPGPARPTSTIKRGGTEHRPIRICTGLMTMNAIATVTGNGSWTRSRPGRTSP
jgi:hypothetical protein